MTKGGLLGEAALSVYRDNQVPIVCLVSGAAQRNRLR